MQEKEQPLKGINKSPRHIVFLACPNLVLLDLAGPWDVFEAANWVVQNQGGSAPYDLKLVSASGNREVSVVGGLSLLAHYTSGEYPRQVDTLIVCGARGMPTITAEQARTSEIMRLFKKARRAVSICVGAFFLAAAGLLDGRKATTHWHSCERLASQYPDITVEMDSIFVKDGPVYTSAGMTAGIDLALALIEEDLGREVALAVGRRLVVSSRRSGGQTQYSPSLQTQSLERESLNELMSWARLNPAENLTVEALAHKVGMSERNFGRVFRREVGQTPGEFVDRLRVDIARQQLEATDLPLERIAEECGLGSADSMRRVFLRILKVTPGTYRSRFRPQSRAASAV